MALKTKATAATGSSFGILDADIYDAALAGVVVKDFQKFDAPQGEMETKFILIFQIPTEQGKARYVKSGPLAIKINEKSNLYAKYLKALTGKSETDLGSDYDVSALIGTPCRLEVVQETGRDGKLYNSVEKAISAGKTKAVIEDGEIPEFMLKGAVEYELHPQIKVKVAAVAQDTASAIAVDDVASPVEPRKRPAKIA
jgi:hypothetical protein